MSSPKQIAKRCKSLGYSACAITDHGNILGHCQFVKAMKAEGLKPILGSEFYIREDEKTNSHLVILAKNFDGWKTLVQMTTAANQPENFYRKPRLSLDQISKFDCSNLISFSGHMGSALANIIFDDYKKAFNCRTYEEAKVLVHPEWISRCTDLVKKYKSIFNHFYIEIQLIDEANLPAATVVAQALRYISKKTDVPCVATSDSHYCEKKDAQDQWILICTMLQTTIKEVQRKLDNDEEVGLAGFFRSNNYHIPSYDEMKAIHTPEEIANSNLIGDMCETYSITHSPYMPEFPCPDGKTEFQYLTELCRKGWKDKIIPKVKPEKLKVYEDRIKEELSVWETANLSGYFLVVQDFIGAARQRGEFVGIGRGSSAGCLTSYLLGITNIDPILHNLSFLRFYNAARNTKDHVSLPDIDCDFQIECRADTIEYIEKKYTHVAQLMTFGRMMGRGALKDVLRAHSACSFEEMNRITKAIPDEAAIADELAEMADETGESSIIQWALDNHKNELAEFCTKDEDGVLSGPYAQYFAQAIRLEGVKKSAGKHPAGLVISSKPLGVDIPLIVDKKSGKLILACDMKDAEDFGYVKFDILGVAAYSKVKGICNLLSQGKL